MQYIDVEIQSKHQIKGSVFLGFLVPYALFKSTLENLKKEHHKARHIVYAYRHLEQGRLQEALHEDREPKNSARGLLDILRRGDLIESAVIVVRYFGGVLLGVGGLMKAYSQSLQLCLQNAPLKPFSPVQSVRQWVSYPVLEILSARARKHGVLLEKQSLDKKGAWVYLQASPELLEKVLGD
ncbi:YigZ family protein [Helicobacter bizzozeronii]|uniref:YigZ family protein n=1 Tax=Helicobacter bizzozeronii TaxID=56877 RepID=UPI000CEDADC4|nr:YigZ family protein [Helicobacter bizzozeronii]